MEKLSIDSSALPRIKLSQPENGYRFSIDPVILADSVETADNKTIIDIGCGSGIIPLILSSKSSDLKIIGIEIQKELYLHAKKNILKNNLENIITIINSDVRRLKSDDINGKADIIVSNPPYGIKGSGRLNPDSQKAIARHEISLDIHTVFKCSRKLLNKKGRLYLIFPASRISDLFAAMEKYAFTPDFIRFVHIKKTSGARRIILCAARNSRKPCTVLPPFYIYGDDNQFSKEYADLF